MRNASVTLLLLAAPALAADITVTPADSIQDAIVAAVDGDRILVDPGTYVQPLDFLGKSIEVIGVQGALVTIVDGGASGPAVLFVNGEGPASRLAGLTITGGSATTLSGGGIHCPGATPTIEDCVIRNNIGKYGGGFHGGGTLRRCTIRNNNASQGFGGGVWGAPTLEDCEILMNTVTGGSGGGVFFSGGTASITGTRIEGNRAILGQGRGCGVHVDSTATVTIERCIVLDNWGAAGVFAGYGGGILVESAGTTVARCTIVDNLLNGSSTAGGGIHGPALVTDSIVRGNTSSQIAGSAVVTYSDVEGGYAGVGNIDQDPLFVDVALDDFHLQPGSPCVDAGDPASSPDPDGSTADMGALPFDLDALSVDRCSGDGGDQLGCTDCPCGNTALPGTIGGCINSTGGSARLEASGSPSVSLPAGVVFDLRFALTGAPADVLCVLSSGDALAPTNTANPCFGLGSGVLSPAFDGLRCAVVNTRRHGGRTTDGNGDVGVTSAPWGGEGNPPAGIASSSGFAAGQVRFFQVTYRDDPAAVCLRGLDTSQAIEILFVP